MGEQDLYPMVVHLKGGGSIALDAAFFVPDFEGGGVAWFYDVSGAEWRASVMEENMLRLDVGPKIVPEATPCDS